MVEYEKEYFTKTAYHDPCYFDFPAHGQRVDKLIKIARPMSVLDVGCAYGYIVRRLLDKGIPAWGCDISKWCEKQAKTIMPKHFKRCPAWHLEFPDKFVDVIYCEGVLEHIPEDKIDMVFSEFKRVADRFYLQISLMNHSGFYKEIGHICTHDANWWFHKMPDNSWLFLPATGTEGGNMWLYKG